jgi:hypothetical protein
MGAETEPGRSEATAGEPAEAIQAIGSLAAVAAGLGSPSVAARVLAMQRGAGNRAVARAILARQPREQPKVETRSDGGLYEVLVDGVRVVQSTQPVEVGSVWIATGEFHLDVIVRGGGEVEVAEDAEIQRALGPKVPRWRIRAARATVRGELLEPGWDVTERTSAAGAAPAKPLPTPPHKPLPPERAPKIPLERGYPDEQLDEAVHARGDLAQKLVSALSDEQMRQLSADDRLMLVDQLASARALDPESITRLLRTTPPHEYAVMAAGLRSDKARTLRKLDDRLTGDDLDLYYGAVAPLLMSTSLSDTEYGRYENALRLDWSGPPLVRPERTFDSAHPDQAITITYRISWTGDGKLDVKWTRAWMLAGKDFEAVIEPDQIIALNFLNDDPEVGAKKGDVRYLPAAAFLALVHRQFRREMWTAVQTGVLVGSLGSAAGAVTWLGRVVSAIETALAAAAYVIDQYRADIGKTEGGREFLKRWDIAQSLIAAYGLARIVLAMPKALRKLVDTYRSVREALGSGHMQEAATVERRIGEINLKLNEAEREAQAAATEAGEARFRVAEPDAAPPSAQGAASEGAQASEPQLRVRVADEGPGRWLGDFESGTNMSEAAASYEQQVTGKASPGTGYYIGTVQFDGFKDGVLQECKFYVEGGRQLRLLRERNMFVGIGLVNQAERQLQAAGRIPIEFHVANDEAAGIIRELFQRNNIPIEVRFTPPAGTGVRVAVPTRVGVPATEPVPESVPPASEPQPPRQQQMRLPEPGR